MKNTYIVGLNVGNHDSSACLLKNGEIASYIEQERISRNKLAIGEAPIDALKACLRTENITLIDVDAIAVGMDWNLRREKYQEPIEERNKYLRFNDPDWYLPKKIFGDKRPEIFYIKHHLAHAASAARLSGFEKAAVLVIDNRGEEYSTSLGVFEDDEISFFKQINIQNSLGIFYNRACRYTGLYGKYREVGKFMGLASYGNPCIPMPLIASRDSQLFKVLPNIENIGPYDSIQLRTNQLNEYFINNCFPYEAGNVEDIMSYANFAASAQKALEEVILDFVAELKEKTGLENLVLAGGVALNCSANGKIEKSGLFKNIFIPPFASDGGTAIGAALEISYIMNGIPKTKKALKLANLGLAFDNEETYKMIHPYADKIEKTTYQEEELYSYIAEKLSQGEIVAWMQDGFEAGPRALGNRSILADPRKRNSLIKLNNIKQREMWRPIAPSVLEENYSDFFEGSLDNKYFMNVATLVKKQKQKIIPAVVHVDETARPQAVNKDNIKYYKLISTFYEKTGVPVLCNTSFNLKGVPLVNSPQDAIECFLKCDIDILVIGNLVFHKKR